MRRLMFVAFGTVLGVSLATLAAAVPTTRPTSADTQRVLVMPFEAVDPLEASPAVAGGVAAHLKAALARLSFLPLNGTVACDDPSTARAAGRAASAATVIYGSYQCVGDRVRFDGGIVTVATGAVIGGLTATGDLATPFDCQDKLAAQVSAVLRPAEEVTPPIPAADPRPPAVRPAYAPLVAMLDRNRTPSNEYAARFQRSLDRQTLYPGAFGYGYGFGGGFGYGGYGVFGPGAVIGGTDYSGFAFAPFANGFVGYGIGGSAPP